MNRYCSAHGLPTRRHPTTWCSSASRCRSKRSIEQTPTNSGETFATLPPEVREAKEAKLVIDRKTTFRVDESFVGPSNPTFVVPGGGEWGVCTNGFTPGKQYLVDAYWRNREWTANIGTATAEVNETPHNVASPAIHGMVFDHTKRPDGSPGETSFTVRLEGPGVVRETRTNRGGAFSFRDLFPGNYTISSHRPGWTPTVQEGVTIDLLKRPCALKFFSMEPEPGGVH